MFEAWPSLSRSGRRMVEPETTSRCIWIIRSLRGSRFARRWDAAKRRETRVVWKTLFRATSTHIGVLVTDFDFGGDPATGLVRIRMVPPFG